MGDIMKNKKKQKVNIKKILLIGIPSVIILLSIIIGIYITNKNNERGVFSILEKRWIEKNKSTVIDVSILNDVPIFGNEGEGVFFDFLKDFTKETELEFNMVPYSKNKDPKEDSYVFEINNKTKLKDNELLFYKDNYILVSKDNEKVKKFSNLDDVTIGVLESDLSTVKDYLVSNTSVVYNTYTKISDVISALNNNEIKYAIIPSNIYIDKVFSNNYYVVYNIPEIYTNYIFNVNGSEKILNSIINKFYIRWSESKLAKSYNQRVFDLYFEEKDIDDVTKADFLSKEYVYGYVKNLPYESKINEDFIGYNSEMLDEFANRMNITFKVREFNSIKDLTSALNNGKVDLAFNYYNFNELTNSFDYTVSPYKEKIVVLSSVQNITTTVNSLRSLKGQEVYMLDDVNANYITNNSDITVKVYKKISSLFNALDDDKIVILDYNTYNHYKSDELSNFKVIYEEDYNFIMLNTNKNKAFISLYKYYISTIDPDIYKARAILKLDKDSKKIDLSFVYLVIGAVFLTIFSIVYFKNRTIRVKIKKEDKMRYVDHLTSLKNRHYLNQNYLKWQANKIYPQAIIVININKIGHINDVYGHEEGDAVIKKAANILINSQLEQSDIVRTNGDEFLIYMVGYEETKVITYMRRLYKEFKSLPYKFGASLGYSMILDDVKTIDDAINEAVLEIKTNKEQMEDNK